MYKIDEKNERTITELNKLPTEEHYAVITETSFTYDDGYGHGGMSSTSTHRDLSYMIFHDIEKLQAWIRKNDESQYANKNYRVVFVKPVSVIKQVSIKIE